jgi:hypothetical protein
VFERVETSRNDTEARCSANRIAGQHGVKIGTVKITLDSREGQQPPEIGREKES